MIIPVRAFNTELWQSLTKSERSLLWALSSYSDKYGQKCYPSISSLCYTTGLAKNALIRARKGIQKKGAVNILKIHGKSNQYDLCIWTKLVPTNVTTSNNSLVDVEDNILASFNDQTSNCKSNPNKLTKDITTAVPVASLSEKERNILKTWNVSLNDLSGYSILEIQEKISLVLNRQAGGVEIRNSAAYFFKALKSNWKDTEDEKQKGINFCNAEYKTKQLQGLEEIRRRIEDGKYISQDEYDRLDSEDKDMLEVDQNYYKEKQEWRWFKKKNVNCL